MSNVRHFGAAGDGKTDDSDVVLHALKDGDGVLHFPRGEYLLTKTIPVPLDAVGRVAIDGAGGTAKILMAGPGPAFHLQGTHEGTAEPSGFKPEVWAGERMPTVLNIEIEGRHRAADGILVEGTMQSTFAGVLLRELRDALRFARRARNVLVSHCHIYNNRRTGIYFDHCNLHQSIITGSHISYNKAAGILIEGGQVRNFQITGNDIEYNYADDSEGSADVLIDCRPEGSTINEGTIASNTIQARISSGGANIRLIGSEEIPENSAGMLTISGNLIGSQEIGIHLLRACSTVISGNMIYGAAVRNLLVENSRNIVVGANSFDHNTDLGPNRQLATGIRIAGSRDVSLSGFQIKDAPAGKHTWPGVKPQERTGLIELSGCRRATVSGLHVVDGTPYGLHIEDSSHVHVNGCTVVDAREKPQMKAAVHWEGPGQGNALTSSRLGRGTDGALKIDEASDVVQLALAMDAVDG